MNAEARYVYAIASEQEPGRRGEHCEPECEQEQHRIAATRLEIERLETAIANRADHQECRHDHHAQHGPRFEISLEPGRVRKYGRRRNAAAAGLGSPTK